jgi:SAM-dependent methyltransferase
LSNGEEELKEIRAGIIGLCMGHRLGNLLFASVELGIFDSIPEGGETAEEVAHNCELDPSAAKVLLQSLSASGLLEREGSRFRVPSQFAPLLRRGPASLIPHIKLMHEESGYWLRAAEILRPAYDGSVLADVQFRDDSVGAYMDLVEWNNENYAELLWNAISDSVPGLRQVLDVGPGYGYFSSALLRLNEHVVVTFYDMENALRRCRQRHEGQLYAHRIRWETGEAPALPYHECFDLVMANDLLHYFSSAEKLNYLRAAREALKPGGRFVVVKIRLEDSGCAPQSAAIFSYKMFLTTHKSYLETDEELELLAQEVGFQDVKRIPLDDFKTLVTGTK